MSVLGFVDEGYDSNRYCGRKLKNIQRSYVEREIARRAETRPDEKQTTDLSGG